MYKENKNFHHKGKNKFIQKVLLVLLTFIIITGNYAFAEKEGGVSGQIKNATTKKPVEFCNIRIFNLKDSLIAGIYSDENGWFAVRLKAGKYKVVSEFIGYKPDTLSVSIRTGNEFIGTIKLKPIVNQLDEVTVVGNSEKILIDKDEYVVTAKMKSGTANTKDVLDKVKGVTYDRYNNSIKVDNEENIMILVNGIQKDQEYILNISPDRLKKIEIIRDPSGRYALEGYSAVINIILKDDYKGLEFYSEDQVLSDLDNKNGYLLPVNNFTASLNYTYNKFNIYGKINNNYLDLGLSSEKTKEYDNGLLISKKSENDLPNLIINRMYDRVTVGFDYYMNPKQTISYESRFNGNFFRNNIQKSLFRISEMQDGSEIDNYNSENINTSSGNNNNHSIFYKSIIDKNNTLNIDFTYSDSKDKYSNDYYENEILIYQQPGINENKNTKFYAEFNHTINAKSGFQVGYGNTWKKVVNTFDFNETEITQTDLRHKLYAYYSWNLNKKFGIKIGAAGETSTPKVEGNKRTFFIYQPYADIKIKPIKMLDIRLKYRSSSNYPSVNEANPDTVFIDNETVSVGNPFLDPSVTHRLSVRFNIMGGLASVEPYYHFSNNYISQTGNLNENGIFEYTYNNAGKYEHYGIKAGLTIPFGKSIFWQNNADFFKSSILYNGEKNSIQDWTMSSNLIYVNKKYKTTTGIIYQNNLKKHITAQGYNMWNNDFWGYMIQQPLLKQRLNVMILYMLPLNFGVDYNQGSFIKTDAYSETNIQDLSILKNILMFRISFRLNKGKAIHKTKKDFKQEKNQNKKGGIF